MMEFAKLIDKIRRDLISDDEVKSMLSTMEVSSGGFIYIGNRKLSRIREQLISSLMKKRREEHGRSGFDFELCLAAELVSCLDTPLVTCVENLTTLRSEIKLILKQWINERPGFKYELTKEFGTFRKTCNPYLMVNMAYTSIFGLSLAEGLDYGLRELEWDESDRDYLEELTLWVAWHQHQLQSLDLHNL